MANGDGAKRTGIWVAVVLSLGTLAAAMVVDHYRTGVNCEAIESLAVEAGEARLERELIKGSLEYTAKGLKGAAEAIGVINKQMQQQAIEAAVDRTEQEALTNRLDRAIDTLEGWE